VRQVLRVTAIPPHRRGFTLVELMVTMGIIAILAMLLLGVLVLVRKHARNTNCQSNLSQLWKAANVYANNYDDMLPVNYFPPLRISNVVYQEGRSTGWGCLFPLFLADHNVLFCPSDQVRDEQWEFGWANWGTPAGRVECSYGYRGRQGLLYEPTVQLTLGVVDNNPQKVIGCDFNELAGATLRLNHESHINLLRCNGQVEREATTVSFAANDQACAQTLKALDKGSRLAYIP